MRYALLYYNDVYYVICLSHLSPLALCLCQVAQSLAVVSAHSEEAATKHFINVGLLHHLLIHQ